MRTRVKRANLSDKKIHHRGELRWIVYYPNPSGGRRLKKRFTKKSGTGGAQEWLDDFNTEVESSGLENFVSSDERSAINEYREKLQEAGISLREAIEGGIKRRAVISGSAPVGETIKRFITLKRRAGIGERQMSDYESRLGRFGDAFGERVISTILVEELDDWLLNLTDSRTGKPISDTTWKNYRSNLRTLFKQAEIWSLIETGKNPITKTQAPKRGDSEPGIVTPAQAASILANAAPEIVPAFAIGLFAGLRRSEIEQLDWNNIQFLEKPEGEKYGTIHFKGKKLNQWRDVDIRKTLADWLQPFRKHE